MVRYIRDKNTIIQETNHFRRFVNKLSIKVAVWLVIRDDLVIIVKIG